MTVMAAMTADLFWFGWVLAGGAVLLILSVAGRKSPAHHPDAAAAAIADLQQQCLRLREELQQQKTQLTADFQAATFEQLQTLLVSYPSACKMTQVKPDLPARNLVALFTPIEELLHRWEIEPIGVPWQAVAYEPHLHQPDTDDVSVGEWVYIRFVGYRHGDRILCPAKVSRSLPPGVEA